MGVVHSTSTDFSERTLTITSGAAGTPGNVDELCTSKQLKERERVECVCVCERGGGGGGGGWGIESKIEKQHVLKVYSFSFHTLKQIKSVAVVQEESVVSLAVVASHAQVGDWR